MQTEYMPLTHARINTFHGPKRQLLGNQAGHAPPAWRGNPPVPQGHMPASAKGKMAQEQGSRIFLSKLPIDVGEKEVEELFRKTVGPLKESFLVYNSQGNSKGMAVVTFQRPGDAITARAKYDGKIVDGRRPIKIEIISDGGPSTSSILPGPPAPPTLLNRLAPANAPIAKTYLPVNASTPTGPRHERTIHARVASAPVRSNVKTAPLPPRRFRQKKGPKRLKKRDPATVADLDKEMEDYRAAAPEYQDL
ncbi:hypothetical protein B0H34DRAFT_713663 [Crassisporium funariophilum]|nr:hypothetical protein B0H34DRAFT_713663 [Crassisporium funariophilum]